MNKITLLNLYLIFLKIGAILLGGGYVILPILLNEFSERRKLVEEEEIVNYFALSQSLPGIIAANISIFIGYKLHGKLGAITAMFGIITVPFLSIVFLASFLSYLNGNPLLEGAFWGVGIAVIALITLTIREVWQKSKRDIFFYSLFTLSLVFLLILKLTPIQTIVLSVIIGIIYNKISLKKEVE